MSERCSFRGKVGPSESSSCHVILKRAISVLHIVCESKILPVIPRFPHELIDLIVVSEC